MTIEVNVHEAKTHLSRYLQQVIAGEEIIIAKSGIPIARLVPIERKKKKRSPGSAKGKISIANDFDALPPEDLLAYFEGNK